MKRIPMEKQVYAFSESMKAVERVAPGDRVRFVTQDALGGQVKRESDILSDLDFSRINPATGPIEIEAASPGDSLVVRVMSIDPAKSGAIVTGPGLGVLGDELTQHLTRILPVGGGTVALGAIRLDARPMIGVIGVAPETGDYPTGTAHRHGGNMDTKEITAGCTLYLPVSQPGAMLAMGDVHAVQGDGEICVSACEIAAEVTVEIDVIAGRRAKWPIVDVGNSVYVLVSLPTIEEALREATRQAVGLIQAAHGLSREEACMAASLGVDIGVSQLVDPNKTAKARIPHALLGRPIEELI